jgi:RecB family exonuclease
MNTAPSTIPAFRREFLGWDRPALAQATSRLAKRYRQGDTLDLGRVIVVVPGQRAGRRLQELLAFLAEDDKLRLTPPHVITEGRLPEMLYTPKLPFASELVQDLAWSHALRDLPTGQRKHLLPHAPPADAAVRWLELGKTFRRLHTELAADGLDFAAVNASVAKAADFIDAKRWHALVAVQCRHLELLDREKLWDIQTARLTAIERREIRTDCDIILLGTVDLNNTLRRMLDQVAYRVAAYIVAPEDLADHFDAHGCLLPSLWCDAMIPLRDAQLRQVDGPADQADAVSGWLAQLGGRYRKDEITIGVPDEALVLQLQRELKQRDVDARWVEGARVGETAPYRLIAAAVAYASNRRYDELAALLRHADLEDWLQGALRCTREARPKAATSLPRQLDLFYNAHLPNRIGVGDVGGNNDDWPDLAAALTHIEEWLQPVSTRQALRAWGERFRKLLAAVYAGRTLNLDVPEEQTLHRTLSKVLDRCGILDSLPATLDATPVSAAAAFQIALGPLADETLPPPADPNALELLGWLELPLDDAPALVVTSFNEGFVPKSAGADAFLPDRLRRELGLLHNERRYARDAFATSVLCHSRKDLLVLFARRDTEKDPLMPSRLIFACRDDELIRRGQQFFGDKRIAAAPRRPLLAPAGAIPEKSLFEVPEAIPPRDRLQRISVTQFKNFLACPYRYYLRHIRGLQAIDDSARELDGGAFGTLLHKVLGVFGKDAAGPRHSDRERDIRDYLDEQLRVQAIAVYREDQRRPAIRLQLEQARQRLSAFATHHAELVRQGWCIVSAEDENNELSTSFAVDNEPIALVGRIDRIDYHKAERKVRILDYKTGDSGQCPDKTHRHSDEWIDLQLPLYRHLWRAAGLDVPADCTVELAYFNLPKKLDDTKTIPAEWDDAMLSSADETAREVIRKLRRGEFGKPVRPAPRFSEDFAAICLDNLYSPPDLGDDDGGGGA